jgi:hypothetical protein
MYGRRDSQIKSFALLLEAMVDGSLDRFPEVLDEISRFIDAALSRRHSLGFHDRLSALASALRPIRGLTAAADAILGGGITGHDIADGFDGIEGVFVAAGPIYSLVTKAEMPEFLAFDSASVEGPRLRMQGVIPSEKAMTGKKKAKNKR